MDFVVHAFGLRSAAGSLSKARIYSPPFKIAAVTRGLRRP